MQYDLHPATGKVRFAPPLWLSLDTVTRFLNYFRIYGSPPSPGVYNDTIRKRVMSIKFLPVILGPEMAAPILWAPGIWVLSAGKPPCP